MSVTNADIDEAKRRMRAENGGHEPYALAVYGAAKTVAIERLERRVAQLEAALRDAMGVHEYMTDAGMTGVEWAVKHKYDPVWDRIRAALAGAPEREGA